VTSEAVSSKPIRVLIVDDHRQFAEALMTMLDADDRIEVIGHAQNGAEAIRLVSSLLPDVVLMDIMMPEMDGIEATRIIRQRVESPCVLILTGSDVPGDYERALNAGAAGYVTKDGSAADLLGAILGIASITSALKGSGT
jgi:DNA-binding NarL/FixJ family response regulator